MTTLKKIKKWTVLFIALFSISLVAYAIIPTVSIGNPTITEITSTTAKFEVNCVNAEILHIYGSLTSEGPFHYIASITNPLGPNNIMWSFGIQNLQPNTRYYFEFKAVGYEDPSNPEGERDIRSCYISLVTPLLDE